MAGIGKWLVFNLCTRGSTCLIPQENSEVGSDKDDSVKGIEHSKVGEMKGKKSLST